MPMDHPHSLFIRGLQWPARVIVNIRGRHCLEVTCLAIELSACYTHKEPVWNLQILRPIGGMKDLPTTCAQTVWLKSLRSGWSQRKAVHRPTVQLLEKMDLPSDCESLLLEMELLPLWGPITPRASLSGDRAVVVTQYTIKIPRESRWPCCT